MTQIPYIFNQLHSYLPRDKFDRLVKKYNGNAYIINYTCWNHLLVMMWAQLTSRRSLRDIETSIRAIQTSLTGWALDLTSAATIYPMQIQNAAWQSIVSSHRR